MGNAYSLTCTLLGQSFRIPKPPLTEKNLADQTGKVFLITGSNTGVGYQVAKILYSRNGTVYVAARTESKAQAAIDAIKAAHPSSSGQIYFLKLDLSDLTTIKASAEDFLSKESRLDWLDNNAGVMVPPKQSKGAQGMDLQYQTNILGPFLFTKLLLPLLKKTAATSAKGSVRVSWAGSLAVDLQSPKGGVAWKADGSLDDFGMNDPPSGYGTTKAANYLLANEFARRYGQSDAVLHNCYNPGNLKTDLQRHAVDAYGALFVIVDKLMLYPSIFGAYTELFAGLAEELTLEQDQGGFIVPWGRKAGVRKDISAERGEGKNSEKLFNYCDEVTKQFA